MKPGVDPKKALAFDEFVKSILSAHRPILGRWHRPAKAAALKDVDRAENLSPSYRYFLRKYGSLTWLLASGFEADDLVFMINNVTGEGMSVLHLPPLYEEGDVESLLSAEFVEENETRGLDQAHLFHGGWGTRGYAFDRRRRSPEGEFAIVPFSIDDPLDGFLDERKLKGRKESIEGFDIWLEKEVARLIRVLEPEAKALRDQIRRDQTPTGKASAPRPKKSVSVPVESFSKPEVIQANAKATESLGKDLIPSYRETWTRFDVREDAWFYVDFEVCGSRLIDRRFPPDTWYIDQTYHYFDSPEAARAGIAALIAPYTKKYKQVTPYQPSKGHYFSRSYRKSLKNGMGLVNVWLEGTTLHVHDGDKEKPPRKFKNVGLAALEMEAIIAALRRRGYIPFRVYVRT